VPRNVDPAIREIANVHLYDVDDLSGIVASQHPISANAIAAAEQIAQSETGHFLAFLAERHLAPYVQNLIEQAEQIRSTQVAQAMAHLGTLDPAQQRAIDALATSLVNKLVFTSIHTLKRAAALETIAAPKP
jgi:glutamyl-tRNA reductase